MKLIYLSPVPWKSVAQRPHFFIKSALNNGFDSILWVEPTPSRLPKLIDLKVLTASVEADSFDKDPNVQILKPKVIPIEPFNCAYKLINYTSIRSIKEEVERFSDFGDATIVIGKPSLLALSLLNSCKFKKSVIDIMDDFPFFFEGIAEKSMYKIMVQSIGSVDCAVFSSNYLYEKYAKLAKKTLLIKNACDRGFLEKSLKNKVNKNNKKQVFGYIGSIAKWFDWNVIIQLANENPNAQIRIIGPKYTLDMPELPENISIESAIEHSKVATEIRKFDYGLIPFKINHLTTSVDPVKYYEYLSAGIKIISTPFGEMKERVDSGKVFDFNNYNTDIECIPEVVSYWDERFESLFSELNDG